MKKLIPFAVLTLAPLVTSAADCSKFGGVRAYISSASGILYSLFPIGSILALLAFGWGIVKFIFNAGDDKRAAEGKAVMKWGILALFVLVSILGIIKFIQGELQISDQSTINLLPQNPCA